MAQQDFQLSDDLLKQIAEKNGLQWGRYMDIYSRKMLSYQLSMPEYDKTGVLNYLYTKISRVLFGGGGFRIKVKKGIPNMGGVQMTPPGAPMEIPAGTQRVQDYIDDHIFGKCDLRANLQRWCISLLQTGNMSMSVGMGAQGSESRFHDGMSCIALDYDSAGVSKMANITFKYMDSEDVVYAIVVLDGIAVRMFQVYDVSGGSVQSRINYGTPEWYKAFGGNNIPSEIQFEIGHKKSQWVRLPSFSNRHLQTPYSLPLLWNYSKYKSFIDAYIQYKKELGNKQCVVYYNKMFDEPEYKKITVAKSFADNNLDQVMTDIYGSRRDTTKDAIFNQNGNIDGLWPDNMKFRDMKAVLGEFNTNFSIRDSLKRKDSNFMVKSLMAKDELIQIQDPAVRPDYRNQLLDEAGCLGKTMFLGKKIVQGFWNQEREQQATALLMEDADFLEYITALEIEFDKPLKEHVLAHLDYAVEMGMISAVDVPTTLGEIEVIWDNTSIMDQNVKTQQMLSIAGAGLSWDFIRKNVFHLSEEESMTEEMKIMYELSMMPGGGQMNQQNSMATHQQEGAFGVLGRSQPKPIGTSEGSGHPKQANNGKGTAKGKTEGKND